ncbi:MAG: beta-lactamase family protein [Acidobacteria bacterium]|nr:beta-lactamase family protein [Acidobacteriota bacterium]
MQRVIIVMLTALCALAMPGPSSLRQNEDYGRESRAAIGAHHLCSGLWVVGRVYKRTPQEVLAQDIAPFQAFGWEESFKYEVDSKHRRVTVSGPGITSRTAQYNGDQGCSILPRGVNDIYFKPVPVPRKLPAAASQPWPTGDAGASSPMPAGVDTAAIQSALDWGMAQKEHNTRAIVLVYGGKIVGERYAPGWTKDTPQISWSQGKSITAALIGVLVRQGRLRVDDPAPVKEWQGKDDPRRQIRVRDLLRMSSGLDFANLSLSGPASFTRENEHMRIYYDGIDVFAHAVNQSLEIPPNTQRRYRNSDPLVLGKIIREMVEARGGNYLTFPQRMLFDPIGARNFVLETDAWGNFIMTGYDYGSARDWARFGLLHLWDGVWKGKRILPEGWVEFISTPAPADPSRGYGGLFWLNRGGAWSGVPEDAFMPSGFMGQHTMVIRSRDAVVVRLGPSPRGSDRYFTELVNRLLAGLPKK